LPDLPAFAGALGCSLAGAEQLADRLVDARLLEEIGPSSYRLPRLARLVTMRWSPR
jgi:hypothetical protein